MDNLKRKIFICFLLINLQIFMGYSILNQNTNVISEEGNILNLNWESCVNNFGLNEGYSCEDDPQVIRCCTKQEKNFLDCRINLNSIDVQCSGNYERTNQDIICDSAPANQGGTLCNINTQDWSKYEHCYRESSQKYKEENCPLGCSSDQIPEGHVCEWSNEDWNNYKGCDILAKLTRETMCPLGCDTPGVACNTNSNSCESMPIKSPCEWNQTDSANYQFCLNGKERLAMLSVLHKTDKSSCYDRINVQESTSCKINSIEWDKQVANNGEYINFTIDSNDCIGKQINISLHEEDISINDFSRNISIRISQNSQSFSWIAKHSEDGWFIFKSNPEYLLKYNQIESSNTLTVLPYDFDFPEIYPEYVELNINENIDDSTAIEYLLVNIPEDKTEICIRIESHPNYPELEMPVDYCNNDINYQKLTQNAKRNYNDNAWNIKIYNPSIYRIEGIELEYNYRNSKTKEVATTRLITVGD